VTVAVAGLFVGSGTAAAGMDNQMSLVDGGGRTMTISQWDTYLDGVFPLDRNRLTREWFHSGRAASLSPLGFDPFGSVITPNLFPGVSISSDLGNGPGIQEVATFSVDVEGPEGSVAVANAHGTVTGAAGGVLLRPFARLISKTGDSVTTYGEAWNMN